MPEQIHFVYILTFANGKIYVGMSRTDKKGGGTVRYRGHARDALKGSKNPVHRAWRKHGAPEQAILSCHATREECAAAEIEAIAVFEAANPVKGYNLMHGGEGLNAPKGSQMHALMREKVWSNPAWLEKCRATGRKYPPTPGCLAASVEARKSNPEWKAKIAEINRRPENRARASERCRQQMADGGAEYLAQLFKGRPAPTTPEQRAEHSERMKARMNTPEGKALARRAREKMLSNQENAAKFEAGRAAWRTSEANRENCIRMAQASATACRHQVRDDETGKIYPSQRDMAKSLSISDAAVSLRVKRGKATRI